MMAKNSYISCILKLKITLFLAISGVIIPPENAFLNISFQYRAIAQITPDRSLGKENSIVNPNIDIKGMPGDQIEGGAIRGTNLFHSFEEFNVPEEHSAYFVNPVGIQHIFSRVTGNRLSQLLGKLGVLGDADLFLINPNGIVFGPNSTLDLNGSFLATTANSLLFEDGTQFNATKTPNLPLLTVSIPSGLQFRDSPGSILNQSQVASPPFGLGLKVQPSHTLALIGGNLNIEGGNITAIRGHIELGSVGPMEEVHLRKIDLGWALNYENVQSFQDIELTESTMFNNGLSLGLSNITTTSNDGSGGGNIQVKGRYVTLTNGSQIAGAGANLSVSASEVVKISGFKTVQLSETEEVVFPSSIGSSAPLTGNEGSVIIDAKNLILENGGIVISNTTGLRTGEQFNQLIPTTVSAGNLIINASESVELVGNDQTGFFSSTNSFGAAGNIIINTPKFIVQDEATISVESTGVDALGEPIATGKAGNIIINGDSLSLNQGLITAETTRKIEGEGGANITLNLSDLLSIENEGLISAAANGTADGGNIEVKTPFLVVSPPTGPNGSDIIAKAEAGNGGRIAINAESIFGIQERKATRGNQTNDLDASSELGLAGVVEITQPDVDPSRGLVELPETIIDPSEQIAQNPCQKGKESEFVITGRGGLPSRPSDFLSSEATGVGLVEAVPREREVTWQDQNNESSESTIPSSVPQTVQPAQGWVFNAQGEVILTAHQPTRISSQRFREPLGNCSAR